MEPTCEAQDRRREPLTLSASTRGHGPVEHGAMRAAVLVAGALVADRRMLQAQRRPAIRSAQLKQLSIEQLANVDGDLRDPGPQPLSQLRRRRRRRDEPADSKAPGAMNVPEAIRYVPGINVAQVTASEWAVSSRGFASANSPDLLVLSDGRSIYTPLFSGVFWDVQDYIMQDIDRIEVVRGPGAALWGSNAVNGVINIITKSAEETQGGWAEAGGGSEERALVAAQYGAEAGDQMYYRVFAKYQDHGPEDYPAGASSDGWDLSHVGFRTDWKADPSDAFTFQGDAYDARIGEVIPAVNIIGQSGPPSPLVVGAGGGNVLAHWQHTMSADSDYEVRVYYDYTHRNDPTFTDDLATFDVDFLEHLPLGRDQSITWGLTGRTMSDIDHGKGRVALNPPDSRDNLASGFVQDEVSLPHAVRLTLGSKLEHNDFSGFEVQPSVRAAWDLSDTRTLWGAVSRAVRVPTRIEQNEDIVATDPTASEVAVVLGNRNFHAEQVLAFELGYRWRPLADLALDLAAFRNRYTGLASLELGTPYLDAATGQIILPLLTENRIDGHATGLEGLAAYSPVDWWRLSVNYSYVQMSLTPLGQDFNRNRFYAGATPRNQVGVQSNFYLPHNVEVYGGLRVLSAIETLPEIVNGTGDAGYQELDLNAIWHATPRLTLSLEGRSLLHSSHAEFGAPYERSAIERSVFGRLKWGF